MKELAFQEVDGRWVLRVDGHESPVLTNQTLKALVGEAKSGQKGCFLDIGRDTSVTVVGGARELSEVLGSLEPDRPLSDDLCERYDELSEDDLEFTDIEPIDTGIVVNGASWGWIPTRIEHPPFALVPIVDDPRDVVAFRAWQSESMTGAVERWGVRLFGDVAVLWHEADGSEPEATYMEPHYVVPDPDEMLALVARDWINDFSNWTNDFSDPGPPCPVCGEEGKNFMGGWILTFRSDGSYSAEEIGRAMATVWKPCTEHAKSTIEIRDGHDTWRWVSDRWALARANDADH